MGKSSGDQADPSSPDMQPGGNSSLPPSNSSNLLPVDADPGSRCNMPGFKTFCHHWDTCTAAPADSLRSGSQCLFTRTHSSWSLDDIPNQDLTYSSANLVMV